jgi:2-polyprenyl-3-methyl-5-hydroxy-6-metoxy-1,4-benzoquinol methylase
MKKEYHSCPLCNSKEISFFLKTEDFMLSHEEYELWKCGECGFIFTQNVPSQEEIGKYYQSQEYISHSDIKKGMMNRLYHTGRSYMLGIKYRMVQKVAKGKNLLDIGTGTGYFPGYMKKKGFSATGVEVDPEARKFASGEFGIRVFSPEDFLEKKIPGTFNVITLWHVLEHLDNFDLYLEQMKAQLAPDGMLVIALPNCTSLDARFYREHWAGYDVPRHLWHFTPSTVIRLGEKHALKVVKMKRLMLDPFYNSMLSEKYKKTWLYMFAGLIIGKLAYIESLFCLRRSSSLVYFLNRREP